MAEKTRCEECNRDFPSQDALTMHNVAKHSTLTQKGNKFSNKNLIIIGIIAVLLIGGFFLIFNSNGKNTNANVVNQNSNTNNVNNQNAITTSNQDVQKITLGMKGNYYPNTITVKSGVPVELTLDNSVRGCYRSFRIPDLGVSKSSLSPTDTIKFTPNKKGTFKFQCSMGMGTGTIIVE